MEENVKEDRVFIAANQKASAYGLHPLVFILLIPTVALSILVSMKFFLYYLLIALSDVVLTFYVERSLKTFLGSILKAFFGSARLTIRN